MRTGNWVLAAAAAISIHASAVKAEISGHVIKIGVLTDMSSLYADVSGPGSVEAAKLAVEKLGGKIAGVPVEVVSADHQNKPDVGASIAARWYDVDGVDVIVDVPNSSVALAVNEVARQRGKALIISGAASSDLTGTKCSPTLVQWTYDTWALAHSTANAVVETGGRSWFFLTADYAFGHALERDTSAVVIAKGGQVLGSVRHPLNTSDFSSYLLHAQASKAQVIGLANAGADTANSIKQAAEFGIAKGGQKLAGLLITIPDIHAVGLQAAQGLLFTGAFYWNRDPESRAFAEALAARNHGIHPDMIQAGVYAAILHYAKAVDQTKSDDGKTVIDAMKSIPTDDPLFGKGSIRADGRKLHPMYLFKVKAPSESKEAWDYYDVVKTIPPEEAFRPLADGACPLVK
jgi:branched-chain amino acid transport system substrate-binding protein